MVWGVNCPQLLGGSFSVVLRFAALENMNPFWQAYFFKQEVAQQPPVQVMFSKINHLVQEMADVWPKRYGFNELE